jgi:bacterioferritin
VRFSHKPEQAPIKRTRSARESRSVDPLPTSRGEWPHGGIPGDMLGNNEAIAALNKMLYNELTAIDQYFLHARMLRHWGLHGLGEIIYKESIGEMRHADWLIERILFLDGLPNLQDLGKLRIGEDAGEVLRSDLALEMTARNDTVSAITLFEAKADYVSRDIATKILIDSEEHVDFLERQLDLVKQLGLQNYLQSAMGPVSNQMSSGTAAD